MAVVTTNLGTVTAYGDAVAAGYTGTKAQWQALMADYATVGTQAAQDAQTASTAAQTATTKAGEASQSATRAENAAASITAPDATLTQAGVAADAKKTGDEISELKSGINDKLNISEIVFTNGAYIKTDGSTVDVNSPVTSASYRYAVVPCKEGDWVEINVDGAGAARGYAFVDSNGNKIYGTAANVVTRGTIRVPANTSYLVLNCKASAEYIPSYKGLLNNYAVEALQVKADAETASSNSQKYTPKGKLCRISLSVATQVVAFLHNTTNRVSPVPDSFIYIRKGTRVYINDSTTTAQFFLLEKAMDETLSAGQWATEYVATKDVYAIPCMRYSDDSDIADADALAKLLTIDFGYRKDDIPMWRNQWFVDGSHRGYMEEAPQSTLASFVRAKVHGYNTCECDLRKTSDGHFVVHHNTSMPSNSNYYIYLHTLEELRTNANMGTYNGITQQILEFKDLVQLMKQLDMKLVVELKFASGNEGSKFTAQDIADLVGTVKSLGMQDRVIWMGSKDSTDHAYAQRFRDADSNCYLAIIDSTTPSEVQPYVISGKPERTLMYARTTYITESVVQSFADIGVNVCAWAVTFSWLYPDWTEEQIKAEIRRCISCGIVGMVLDKWTISELVREEYADYL
jgi:glycerophosphoryl diester phosphodiesterase